MCLLLQNRGLSLWNLTPHAIRIPAAFVSSICGRCRSAKLMCDDRFLKSASSSNIGRFAAGRLNVSQMEAICEFTGRRRAGGAELDPLLSYRDMNGRPNNRYRHAGRMSVESSRLPAAACFSALPLTFGWRVGDHRWLRFFVFFLLWRHRR
jgi:hypothetical protein